MSKAQDYRKGPHIGTFNNIAITVQIGTFKRMLFNNIHVAIVHI